MRWETCSRSSADGGGGASRRNVRGRGDSSPGNKQNNAKFPFSSIPI